MKSKLKLIAIEVLRMAKAVIIRAVSDMVKDMVGNFIEEHFIKKPLKKIWNINKRWGIEEPMPA